MDFTPFKINLFVFAKLPSAYLCGVRAKEITPDFCKVSVRYRWINQNPFRSMYFAVQAMAAELSTGSLVMMYIKTSQRNVSMLVASSKSSFSKKATGTITFICSDGQMVSETIQKAIVTGEPQTMWLKSIGTNEDDIIVSEMEFEWTVKAKP
ncbi:DUF4442 domain-containing protein [Flavobacterium pallidum]|uniref:Thioesterase n=1 Tax=Flavobacterium pallidum TaxID=2172098 RepID=A0A2S1SI48_9FLAO|nr:DUF4442 domain-containing protein [Flavobacterium pallidum]AWI26017.1 thioesterase [Flavobacterium pallidum]